MQDLMNNPYFLFTLISTKQVFITPASPTPYLVKLQRPATNCCHDLYTFVTFDTVYIWYVWASSTDSGIEEQFPNTFLQSLNTLQQWQTDQLTHLLPQENINTTWSRPHYIQSVTSKTCLEYLIIPWWIKGKTFKTRLIDIYNCLDELYLEHLSVSKFKPNVTVRFY